METLDDSLVTVLQALGIRRLNDVQKVASKAGLFDSDKDLAIVSQSRTGKSFAGSLFVANEVFKEIKDMTEEEHESDRTLGIIVAPFHASARETANMISQYFGWFLRPLVLVGEVSVNTAIMRLSKGLAPNLLILTPEALRDMLRVEELRKWFLNRRIVASVFDDVHSIVHDPSRGMALFEISEFLRKIIHQKPRFLVLSAQFDRAERLEDLFGVKVIEDPKKYPPPNLEIINYKDTDEKKEKLKESLLDLADQGIRTLVYMQSIDRIDKFLETYGDELGESVSYDIDHLVRQRLERIETVLEEIGYPSAGLVHHGIGSYHAQLSEIQRWYIEWVFRRQYIRFLFGTEALAYGVNTPVNHVVMAEPGIDEIFRQSMMARAVRMRRGKGLPGDCSVYSKTISDSDSLESVYYSPKLPFRFISSSHLGKTMVGLIGLGLLKTESDRKHLSRIVNMLFKKTSTSRILKKMMKSKPAMVEMDSDGDYVLASFGKTVLENGLSHEQAMRIVEGIELIKESQQQELLTESKKPPCEFDMLLIMNYAAILDQYRVPKKRELTDELQDYYMQNIDSCMAYKIIDTKLEKSWQKAIEYSVLFYTDIDDEKDFDGNTRKSVERLRMELEMFYPRFRGFLEGVLEGNHLGDDDLTREVIGQLIEFTEKEQYSLLVDDEQEQLGLRFRDLGFIDFGDIEGSIDAVLESDLTVLQKARLLELLDSVQSTTTAFVDLIDRSVEDEEARTALEMVCRLSSAGFVGKNLVRALEEEGVVERGTLDGLWTKFNDRVEELQKRTDAPAKAAKVVVSLFTGDLVGLATSSVGAARALLGRVKGKVDTRGLS